MESPLFDAIKKKLFKIVDTLLSQGAVDVNVQNRHGDTPLHAAVTVRNIAIIKLLIDKNADVNLKNKKLKTPMYAVLNYEDNKLKKNTEKYLITKMLVIAGAETKIMGKDGQTALHVAAKYGDLDLVKLVISRGVNVNAKDKSFGDWTALHYAAKYVSSEDPAIFKAILSAGADVNAKANDSTALHKLAECFHEFLTHTANQRKPFSLVEVVRVFAEYGADLRIRDPLNMSPMDLAIAQMNTEAVKAFVTCFNLDVNGTYRFPVNKKVVDRKTYIHGACDRRDFPTFKFLAKKSNNLNVLDNDNVSLLQFIIDRIYCMHHGLDDGNDTEDDGYEGDRNDMKSYCNYLAWRQDMKNKYDDVMVDIFDMTYYMKEYKEEHDDDDNPDKSDSILMKCLKFMLKRNPDVNTITKQGRNILTPCHFRAYYMPDYLWKTIIEHLAKLKACESPVHDSLLKTIRNKQNYKKYFEQCEKELENMKISKIHPELFVTYFNILVDDKKKLIQYAGNKCLAKNFTGNDDLIKKKFPIYGDTIKHKILKAVENHSIWNKVAVAAFREQDWSIYEPL